MLRFMMVNLLIFSLVHDRMLKSHFSIRVSPKYLILYHLPHVRLLEILQTDLVFGIEEFLLVITDFLLGNLENGIVVPHTSRQVILA